MAIALLNVKTGQVFNVDGIAKIDARAAKQVLSSAQTDVVSDDVYQVIDADSKQAFKQFKVLKQGDDLIIHNVADNNSYIVNDFWDGVPLADTATTPLASLDSAQAGTVISTEVGAASSGISMSTLGWIGAGVAVIGGGAAALAGGGGSDDNSGSSSGSGSAPTSTVIGDSNNDGIPDAQGSPKLSTYNDLDNNKTIVTVTFPKNGHYKAGDMIYFTEPNTQDVQSTTLSATDITNGIRFEYSPTPNTSGTATVKVISQDGVSTVPSTITTTPINHTGKVTISGEAKRGETLTAVVTDKDGFDESNVSYQWKMNGRVISRDKTLELTESHVGENITVDVSYIDKYGSSEHDTASTGLVTNQANILITGDVKEGETLTAELFGVFSNVGMLTYTWSIGGEPVLQKQSYSKNDTFSIPVENKDISSYVGKNVSVTVSYKDYFGTQQTITKTTTDVIAEAVPDITAERATGSYDTTTITGKISPDFGADGKASNNDDLSVVLTVTKTGKTAEAPLTGILDPVSSNLFYWVFTFGNQGTLKVDKDTGNFTYTGLPKSGSGAQYKFDFTVKDSDGDVDSVSTTAYITSTRIDPPSVVSFSSDDSLNSYNSIFRLTLPAGAKLKAGEYYNDEVGGKLIVDVNGEAKFVQTSVVSHNADSDSQDVFYNFKNVVVILDDKTEKTTNFTVKSTVTDSLPDVIGNAIADTHVIGGNIGKINFGADGKAASKTVTVSVDHMPAEELIQQPGTENIYKSDRVTLDLATGDFVYTGSTVNQPITFSFVATDGDGDSITPIELTVAAPKVLEARSGLINADGSATFTLDLPRNFNIQGNQVVLYKNGTAITDSASNVENVNGQYQVTFSKQILDTITDTAAADDIQFTGKLALVKTVGDTTVHSPLSEGDVIIYQNTNADNTIGLENSLINSGNGNDIILISGSQNGINNTDTANINTGAGNDNILISGTNGAGIVNATTNITTLNTDAGDDSVKITSVKTAATAQTLLNGGNGNDTLVLVEDYKEGDANTSNYTLFGTETGKTSIVNFETIDLNSAVNGRTGNVSIDVAVPTGSNAGQTVTIIGNTEDKVNFADGWGYAGVKDGKTLYRHVATGSQVWVDGATVTGIDESEIALNIIWGADNNRNVTAQLADGVTLRPGEVLTLEGTKNGALQNYTSEYSIKNNVYTFNNGSDIGSHDKFNGKLLLNGLPGEDDVHIYGGYDVSGYSISSQLTSGELKNDGIGNDIWLLIDYSIDVNNSKELQLFTGDGNDVIQGIKAYVSGSGSFTADNDSLVIINTEQGDDSIRIGKLEAGHSSEFKLFAGEGNDTIVISEAIRASNSSHVLISGGDGDDIIDIDEVNNYGSYTEIDGGNGNDTLALRYDYNSNYTLFGTEQGGNKTNIVNFETIDLSPDREGVSLTIATPTATQDTVKILGTDTENSYYKDKVRFTDTAAWTKARNTVIEDGHEFYSYSYNHDDVSATVLIEKSVSIILA